MRRHPGLLCIAVALVALGSACGGDDDDSSGAGTATDLRGDLTVFAAASLTDAFVDTEGALQQVSAELSLSYNFAGSQALARQIEDGAPADLFASADEQTMDRLVTAGVVDAPRVFARNMLEIAVAPGNPKHITRLADLARPDVVLVLADPSVPVGAYSLQAFERAGIPAPAPKSRELDVKATLAKLTLGEADAVVVYATDVEAAGNAVEGVEIPAAHNVVATYPIAVVVGSEHADAARAFIDEVVHGAGQAALRARGFLAPP